MTKAASLEKVPDTFFSPEVRGAVSNEFLYKYRSFEQSTRLYAERLLLHSELYFASPASFNDPFDCRVRVSMDGTDEQHRANLERLFLKCAPTWSEADRRNKVDQIIAEGRQRDPRVYKGATKGI